MDLVDDQSVGIESCPAGPGTAEPVSTLPLEFDWGAYLNFGQDETESDLWTILAEASKTPSFEDGMQAFECHDYLVERNQIEQSAQQLMSPTSLNSSQSVFAAVNSGDHERNCAAQNLNRSTSFITPEKSNALNFVEIEEHHDPDGLAGLFGLTLEQAQQGVRRPVKKKKQVEPIKTPTLCQPARVQKPKPAMTKSASIQHNSRYAGLLPHEKFLAGLLEEEFQRVNPNDSPSQPTTREYGHPATPNTSAQTLHQDLQPLAQGYGQLTEQQMLLARQQFQTTEKVQPVQQAQQAQHIQRFQSTEEVRHPQRFQFNQQYNALQRQTQSLLTKQHTLQNHCQPTRQMVLGYEAAVDKPHLIPAQQQYRQDWSNVQTHAHPQVQHMALHSHQQGRASMDHNYSLPTTQFAPPPPQQIASSTRSRQAQNSSPQQVFYSMPQHVVNGSSQMRAPGQQQALLGHHSQISPSPQQAGYNFSHSQYQTQPSPNHVAGSAFHGMAHNAQASQQRVRGPLNAQQQQWFCFYTQGHA